MKILKNTGMLLILTNVFIFQLLFCANVFAKQALNGGFVGVSTKDYTRVQSKFEVSNMPQYRSLDSIGLCAPFSASVLLDHAHCEGKAPPCLNRDEDRVSTLYLNTYGRTTGNITTDHSDPREILRRALNDMSVPSEACAPFVTAVNNIKTNSDASASQEAAWIQLEKDWKRYQEIKDCPECLQVFESTNIAGTKKTNQNKEDGIIAKFGLQKSPIEVLEAFNNDTYEKAVNELFFNEGCKAKEIKLSSRLGLELYPSAEEMRIMDEENKKRVKKSRPPNEVKCAEDARCATTLKKVRDLMKGESPITVSGYCVDDKTINEMGKKCDESHSFVISGYKEVCKGNDCREMVKVHNSWGQEWQDANDDGWVDAKSLFDRVRYVPDSIGWVTNASRI